MTSRVPIDVRIEIIRLRTEENLSTPTIARKLGVCNASVYKVIRDRGLGRWNPPLEWRQKNMNPARGKWWMEADKARLRELWPRADKTALLAAFPGRSWGTIGRQAANMGIRRLSAAMRSNKRAVHPLIAQLRQVRLDRRMTRPELSAKCGYHVQELHMWEMGKARPFFHAVADWAEALGFKLALSDGSAELVADEPAFISAPKQRAQKLPWQPMVPASQKYLMAGR